MARKKGSKRARLFVGGSTWGSRGGFSVERYLSQKNQLKEQAAAAKPAETSKPAAVAPATKTVQPASGAQSARDFAPVVEGSGTTYTPSSAQAAVEPSSKARGVVSAGNPSHNLKIL